MALPKPTSDLRFWMNMLLAAVFALIAGLLIGMVVFDWTEDIEDRIERLERVADSTAVRSMQEKLTANMGTLFLVLI